MSTQATLSPGAGRPISGPGRRRPTDSIQIQQLEALRHRLEELILDVRYRSPNTIAAFERTVEEAESIGIGIRAVFRGGALPSDNQRGGTHRW